MTASEGQIELFVSADANLHRPLPRLGPLPQSHHTREHATEAHPLELKSQNGKALHRLKNSVMTEFTQK